jgi:tRNA modification GTPase
VSLGVLLDDTICAISSSVGPAARIIVRLSGPRAPQLARGLAAALPGGASAQRQYLSVDGLSFPVWVYQFIAPHSFTGQDLIELHIPGNPLLARRLLDRLARDGARSAEPGEFTARAFFNAKLDLAQAEGVAAAIGAQTRRQLHAARRLMAGELSRRLAQPMDQLMELLALVEVAIDFSEEDVQVLTTSQARHRLHAVRDHLRSLVQESVRFETLSHEPMIVLAGRPNAGKSTLANALASQARSIVSPVAGTTRDVLSVELKLPRGTVRLIDMAGIEDPATVGSTPAHIQEQMQRQAQRHIAEADVLVLVRDVTDVRPALDLPRAPDSVIYSKSDLLEVQPPPGGLYVSARSGQNLAALREELDRLAFGADAPAAAVALAARHVQSIEQARTALERAHARLDHDQLELLAADLREALDALGQILGVVTPDDILGRIFSSFCIGK